MRRPLKCNKTDVKSKHDVGENMHWNSQRIIYLNVSHDFGNQMLDKQ